MTLRSAMAAMAIAALALSACAPEPAIRIGFIGGLSQRQSDLDQDGRNGLILAVEQRNHDGGIKGRKIELLVRDEGNDPQQAAEVIRSLIADQVDVVIGPFTSAVAVAALPLMNEARVLMISPLVNAGELVGKDDFLIRMNRSTRDSARAYAQQLYQRGQRRVAIAYDTGNISYTGSWLSEFKMAFPAMGGRVDASVPFGAKDQTVYANVVRRMLAGEPDGLLFIANARDVAQLAQQAGKLAPELPVSASEWAGNTLLIELGGQAVEGLLVAQPHNPDDTSPRYQNFRAAYKDRFHEVPGFSSIATHDAATVVLQAIDRLRDGESIKDAVLKYGPYQGLQQSITFDPFGDTPRKTYFTQVRHGKFVLLQ